MTLFNSVFNTRNGIKRRVFHRSWVEGTDTDLQTQEVLTDPEVSGARGGRGEATVPLADCSFLNDFLIKYPGGNNCVATLSSPMAAARKNSSQLSIIRHFVHVLLCCFLRRSNEVGNFLFSRLILFAGVPHTSDRFFVG